MNERWISIREALQICEDYKKNITRVGLVDIGLKKGFARKSNDEYHWEFETEKLKQYLRSNKKKYGFFKIEEIAEMYNLSYPKAWRLIKKFKITTERISGTVYAKKSEFDNQYKGSSYEK